MNRSNVRTIALVGAPVLIVAALLGGAAAGALDDETETVTTAIPASDAAVESPTVQPEAALDGAQPNQGDAADAGIIDPDDRPLTNSELDRVQRAALAIAGGGTVSDIDRSDDLGEAYEVEVLSDVGEVDIALDRNLERVPNLRYDD